MHHVHHNQTIQPDQGIKTLQLSAITGNAYQCQMLTYCSIKGLFRIMHLDHEPLAQPRTMSKPTN